jgi:UDP-N-acetyl-D-mannosaminuronic acid dehydrogenase
MKSDIKICIMGLGYIGLPTAAIIANSGYNVHGVDVIQNIVDSINQGKVHIKEPGLNTFVKSAVFSGKLKAATKPKPADIFIIAVPTPIDEDNTPDLKYVFNSIKMISPCLKNGNLIIIESTSPVGTTEKVRDMVQKLNPNLMTIQYAYCPERVLPGQTMKELIENDRIIGGITLEAAKKAKEFYSSFVNGNIFITNSRTAEMTKLAENAYRDVNIAFANELSMICDNLNINVWELIKLANRHPRVNIHRPGCGVGGHCIAIDPWFIVSSAEDDAKIIRKAREINNYKHLWVIEKIDNLILKFENSYQRKPRIACMGITFKPNIDDLRESPALQIVNMLIKDGRDIMVVEPNIQAHESISFTQYNEAVNLADIIVFLVAHDEFKDINIPDGKLILDVCGIFE